MNGRKKILFLLLLLFSSAAHTQPSQAPDNVGIVQSFVAAFNAHDAAAMAERVTEDIQWFSVRGNAVTTGVQGKAAFVVAMRDYFSSCPSCRSEIREVATSRDRVSVIEVASWVVAGERKRQQSVAIYAVSGSLIRSVHYFPEEPVE